MYFLNESHSSVATAAAAATGLLVHSFAAAGHTLSCPELLARHVAIILLLWGHAAAGDSRYIPTIQLNHTISTLVIVI